MRTSLFEAVSAVMALQHADWLGLALGVVRRGPGIAIDPELVQADVERLDEVEGEIEDREGHLAVLEMALLHLVPLWQDLDVLDQTGRITDRGVWDYPVRCTGCGHVESATLTVALIRCAYDVDCGVSRCQAR